MSKAYDFLKDCYPFYVVTVDGDRPAARPFGAIAEFENELYIATSNAKAVYRQLKANGNIQLVANRPGTREWIRVSGEASECTDIAAKQRMMDECPILTKHYPSANAPNFAVFRIKVTSCEFN